MALKTYCQECGEATEYITAKPKFCTFCGANFLTGAKLPPKPQKQAVIKQPVVVAEVDDETQTDDTPLPEIEKLDVQIQKWEKPKVTLGSIGHQPPSTDKFKRPVPKQLSKKKLLEEFRKEAGGGNRSESILVGGE